MLPVLGGISGSKSTMLNIISLFRAFDLKYSICKLKFVVITISYGYFLKKTLGYKATMTVKCGTLE